MQTVNHYASATPAEAAEFACNTGTSDDSRAATPNEQLRALVAASKLPPAVAMTVFNRHRGDRAPCSVSQWKGYLAEPGSNQFLRLPEDLLLHAIRQFADLGVTPAAGRVENREV